MRLVNVQDAMDLENRAKLDLLTGIYNKIPSQEQVDHILEHSPEGTKHTFLFLDLDDFKGTNHNLGHSFGDFLLSAPPRQKVWEIQIGYADENHAEVFFIMARREDTRLASMKSHIDTAHRGGTLLEDNKKLTILYANHFFYSIFATNRESCKELFNNEVSRSFRKDKKVQILAELEKGLEHSKTYHTELEIISASGIKAGIP